MVLALVAWCTSFVGPGPGRATGASRPLRRAAEAVLEAPATLFQELNVSNGTDARKLMGVPWPIGLGAVGDGDFGREIDGHRLKCHVIHPKSVS